MGVGKSTIGRRLARRLELPFVDSDSAIEDAAGGASTAEIFDQYGEVEFRDGERRLVARLVEGERRVIATGGGAFVNEETRRLLKAQAVTIWLDAPIDVLAERTGRRDNRPLLRGPDREQTLARLDRERRPFYAQADIHIRSGDGAHGNVVDLIVAALDKWFAR